MSQNPTYQRLIHTTRWLRLRRDTLTRHPTCQDCEERGQLRAATEVHHAIPCEHATSEAEMRRLMYDPHNLVALCHPCHVERHNALGRSGRAATQRIAAERLDAFRRRWLDQPDADPHAPTPATATPT